VSGAFELAETFEEAVLVESVSAIGAVDVREYRVADD